MRPNTSWSGIFSTKRRSPVSTSMLTRMLVPNPKSAFQSPIVHTLGRNILSVAIVIARPRQKGLSFDARSAPEAEVTNLFGRFASKNATSASTRGLEDLEAEADAGEADRDVFVRRGNRGGRPDLLLRQQKVVVDDVVVLEAGLGVPGA